MAFPPTILLLRHGEKPTDKTDIHLSSKGQQRAAALAPYLVSTYGIPTAIYAMGQKKATTSVRPIETMRPTATVASIPLITKYDKDSYRDMTKEILGNTAYAGKTIFICWEHNQLLKIAKKLGVPKKSIPQWQSDDFDHIWRLTFASGSYGLQVIPQKLLFGDSAN